MTFATRLAEHAHAVRMRMLPLAHRAGAAWQQRTPREQTFLRGGALLLVALLLWELALGPALHTIQAARAQLPRLQAQSAQLGAIILEAQALSQKRTGALPATEVEPALQASLQAAGLETVSFLGKPAGVAASDMQWQVQFANAPAGRVMAWMSNLPLVAQLQTVRVELTRSTVNDRERPGQLDGIVVLTLQAPGKSS